MADSAHKKILDAMVTAIQSIGLSGVTSSNVKVLWGIDTKQGTFPAIFVCPAGTETAQPYTNERDRIDYPCAVFILDRTPLDGTGKIDTALRWRQQIRQEFHEQRLSVTGVTVLVVRADPSPILDVSLAGEFQMLVEPLVFRVSSLETRG